jgi:hypothetical protein
MEKLQLQAQVCVKYGEKLMFGFKNDLFTIKIMKGEHLYIYNRL